MHPNPDIRHLEVMAEAVRRILLNDPTCNNFSNYWGWLQLRIADLLEALSPRYTTTIMADPTTRLDQLSATMREVEKEWGNAD